MMRVCRSSSLFTAILLVAPACTDPAPGEHSTSEAIGTYVPQQGRLILGFKDPDGRIFDFSTSSHPQTRVRAQGELFEGTVGGAAYNGLMFASTDGTKLRINGVTAPATPEDRWEYVVEQMRSGATTWEPACEAPRPLVPYAEPLPDPVPAIAMTGVWVGPLYWNLSSYITLSCKTGVVAKCAGWGFPVDSQWPHVTKGGLIHWASGGDMMQTCSRMARADYCANGMPNTLDGTPIQIDNVFDGLRPHDGMDFEAAWTGKAIADGSPATNLPVVCLSKRRWSTLPLGGNCPVQVPDPRVTKRARFCEDLDMEARGALLYSSSSYMDAGLYSYNDPISHLYLTTASLLPQTQGLLPAWTFSPQPDVPFPAANQPTRFEASIFVAALPVTIPEANLVKLISYQCAGDLVTTTSGLIDPSCTQIAHEGYVFPRNAGDRAPLRRWSNTGTKRSYTTTISPTTMMANGWSLVETVGGVLRAAIDVNVRWSALPGYSYSIDAQTAAGGWITSCIDSAHIGTATSFAYQGFCVGNNNTALNHADIIAFRVVATSTSNPTVTSDRQSYDGFSSDVYVPLAGAHSLLTAVEFRWNDLGPKMVYSLEVGLTTSDTLTCADAKLLGDSTSYVHTGRCWSAGANAPASKIRVVKLCAYLRDSGALQGCGDAKLTGTSPIVNIKLNI
jgi:ADYC domain